MSIILGLLILCLGFYFLTQFFQLARLEKGLVEGVTLLEKFMIQKYALGETKKPEEGDGKGEAGAASGSSKA